MALRALSGKLRGVLGHQAASGALTQITCEHCGKPSSRIAASVDQKSRATKDGLSEELRRLRMKHYAIRTIVVVGSTFTVWMILTTGIAFIEDDEKFNQFCKNHNSKGKK